MKKVRTNINLETYDIIRSLNDLRERLYDVANKDFEKIFSKWHRGIFSKLPLTSKIIDLLNELEYKLIYESKSN